MSEKNYFKHIITNDEHFFDMPDCIADGESYKETIENSFKITNNILRLEEFMWSDKEDQYQFELLVNGEPRQFSVKKMSDYVDSESLLNGLNKILDNSNYTRKKQFCDLNGGVADFGIAFIEKDKEIELAKEGLIWRNESFYSKDQQSIQSGLENKTPISDLSTNETKPWWKFWK